MFVLTVVPLSFKIRCLYWLWYYYCVLCIIPFNLELLMYLVHNTADERLHVLLETRVQNTYKITIDTCIYNTCILPANIKCIWRAKGTVRSREFPELIWLFWSEYNWIYCYFLQYSCIVLSCDCIFRNILFYSNLLSAAVGECIF